MLQRQRRTDKIQRFVNFYEEFSRRLLNNSILINFTPYKNTQFSKNKFICKKTNEINVRNIYSKVCFFGILVFEFQCMLKNCVKPYSSFTQLTKQYQKNVFLFDF